MLVMITRVFGRTSSVDAPALIVRSAFSVLLFIGVALFPQRTVAATCESLAKLQLPDTTIALAQTVSAGAFEPPPEWPKAPGPAPYKNLPEFCRVSATLRPTPDSDIEIEVWMPVSGWNGKFQASGNPGWLGHIQMEGLPMREGYAVAATDTGHKRSVPSFALDHPEKLIDFGWRAVHEMTVKAKAIIAADYGSGPKRSYWTGCSSGGKQGIERSTALP